MSEDDGVRCMGCERVSSVSTAPQRIDGMDTHHQSRCRANYQDRPSAYIKPRHDNPRFSTHTNAARASTPQAPTTKRSYTSTAFCVAVATGYSCTSWNELYGRSSANVEGTISGSMPYIDLEPRVVSEHPRTPPHRRRRRRSGH